MFRDQITKAYHIYSTSSNARKGRFHLRRCGYTRGVYYCHTVTAPSRREQPYWHQLPPDLVETRLRKCCTSSTVPVCNLYNWFLTIAQTQRSRSSMAITRTRVWVSWDLLARKHLHDAMMRDDVPVWYSHTLSDFWLPPMIRFCVMQSSKSNWSYFY